MTGVKRIKGYTKKDGTKVKSHLRNVEKVPFKRFNDRYDAVQEWKQSYNIEHFNLNMAEEALFDNIERSGYLVRKLTPENIKARPSLKGAKYITNIPGSKATWLKHRSLSELDSWYDRVA